MPKPKKPHAHCPQKRAAHAAETDTKNRRSVMRLHFRLGLGQPQAPIPVFPLATLLEQIHALETLQHIPLHGNLA
jgi:hypothetical protein